MQLSLCCLICHIHSRLLLEFKQSINITNKVTVLDKNSECVFDDTQKLFTTDVNNLNRMVFKCPEIITYHFSSSLMSMTLRYLYFSADLNPLQVTNQFI